MCGICGLIYHDFKEKVDSSLVEKMVKTLSHRGPDDYGVWINKNVGLGHARLSIIDLSSKAHQPICNEDKTVWLVFNGEIYNFKELREGLIKRGHVFFSDSDSEVIVHLWEEQNVHCVDKLNGMFAFAIWDTKTKTLFLARDRIGQKPLFYAEWNGIFAFGSEVKSILEVPTFKSEPDIQAIHYYLTYQSVPSPYSAFKNVKKLPPAHFMLMKNGTMINRRYWDFSYDNQFEISDSNMENELADSVIMNLRKSIKRRLVSDVPVGAFLSGGLDSSLVVALMAEMSNKPVKTFSIGFDEKEYDETEYARRVADRYKTEHTVFTVKPKIHEILDDLVWYYNEPFADPSAIPTFYLSRMAAQHVKVVLTGDAGDENFAGYPRYQNTGRNEIKQNFLSLLFKLARSLPKRKLYWNSNHSLLRNCKRIKALGQRKLLYYYTITHFHEQYQQALYSSDFKEDIKNFSSVDIMLDKYAFFKNGSFIDKTLGVDLLHYMPDTLMVKTDIASMVHSLEARSPMLDYEFIEFTAKIPSSLKLKDDKCGKYILKKAAEPYLPYDIIYRNKMGFGVPLDYWFRNELKDFAYDILLSEKAVNRGYFDVDYIRSILDRHQLNTGESWHYLIWNLLFLELWHLKFIDA